MIYKFANARSGFASTSLLLFLPLITLIVLTFAFICYFIQFKTKMRSYCLTESIAIQKSLVQSQEALFKLNPLAQSLRLQLAVAEAELAVAPPPAVPAVLAQIAYIKLNQQRLDAVQKTLIKSADLSLKIKMSALQNQLSNISHQMKSIWSFYIESFTLVQNSKMTELGIQPDSPDWAPVYELATDYKQRQKMVYQWQHRFHTRSEAQTLTNSHTEFEMACTTTAQKERGLWTILISEDKY